MRIVNIILTSVNGGAEQVFVDYLVALKNLGHEVLAITKTDAPYADEVEKLGIKVKKIKNNFGYHDIFAVSNLKNILQEFDADIVLSHAGRAASLSKKVAKKIKNKKILEVAVNHSMNVKRSIGADIILSVNKEIFFRTIDAGQSENSSFVISNAVDLKDAIANIPKVQLHEKEVIVIGTMGRLDESKGFACAIKAIKNLQKLSNKKFILRIAGSGPKELHLRSSDHAAAQSRGVHGRGRHALELRASGSRLSLPAMQLHVLPAGPIQTNAYLLVAPERGEAVLIDAPGDVWADVEPILKANQARLTELWITHGHWDHITDNFALQKLTGAKIACGIGDKEMLTKPSDLGWRLPFSIHASAANVLLKDGDEIKLSREALLVISTPGHTPGSICLYSKEDKIVFTGDTLFAGAMGRTDFPGGDALLIKKSLNKLAKLPEETKVLPGHGELTLIKKEKEWM